MIGDELRDRVRADVAARAPVDEREAASVDLFLATFDALAEPFSELADTVHVTASGIVVGRRGVVLLKHKRLGIWLQPGGHIDPGETPWHAARRESEEETGLAVSFADVADDGVPLLVHVDVHPGGRGHTHLDLRYRLQAADHDPRPPIGESQEIGWFEWARAIEHADEGLRGALRALRPPV